MSSVQISLVIATYNRGARIGATLDSVLAQSVAPFETIVVDDGSTDNTGDWVERNYPSIRLVRKVNGGTSSARNAGAAVALGKWLMFLDHDDLLLPGAIECLTKLANAFSDVHAVHADHIYENTVTGERYENHHSLLPPFRRLMSAKTQQSIEGARQYDCTLYRSLLRGNLLQQPYAVRRSSFEQVGGYNPEVRYCEDWDLYLRITQKFSVAVSDEVISIHRVEGENLHLTDAMRQEKMYEKVLRGRQLSHRWYQVVERWIVGRKLAAIYKGQGDREAQCKEFRKAWLSYLQSATAWPMDHVVFTRLLLWMPLAIVKRHG